MKTRERIASNLKKIGKGIAKAGFKAKPRPKVVEKILGGSGTRNKMRRLPADERFSMWGYYDARK